MPTEAELKVMAQNIRQKQGPPAERSKSLRGSRPQAFNLNRLRKGYTQGSRMRIHRSEPLHTSKERMMGSRGALVSEQALRGYMMIAGDKSSDSLLTQTP